MPKEDVDSELEARVREADDRALAGRVERLRILESVEDSAPRWVDALANEYYEEARFCWYVGAFVAATIMCQLALEELLRSKYRVAKGVNGRLDSGIPLSKAGFANLVDQAMADRLLTRDKAALLHRLRVEFRNPHMRSPDVATGGRTSHTDFLRQYLKITAPELAGASVVDEARDAVTWMVTIFPEILRRSW
jgi:hypothetical protein